MWMQIFMGRKREYKFSQLCSAGCEPVCKRRRIHYASGQVSNPQYSEENYFYDLIVKVRNHKYITEDDDNDDDLKGIDSDQDMYVEYDCHGVYLAMHSKYFEKIHVNGKNAKQKNIVIFEDMNDIIFDFILSFCYPSIPYTITKDMVLDIIPVASKYCFDGLLDKCIDYLKNTVILDINTLVIFLGCQLKHYMNSEHFNIIKFHLQKVFTDNIVLQTHAHNVPILLPKMIGESAIAILEILLGCNSFYIREDAIWDFVLDTAWQLCDNHFDRCRICNKHKINYDLYRCIICRYYICDKCKELTELNLPCLKCIPYVISVFCSMDK